MSGHFHITNAAGTKREVVREAVPGHTATTYTYECACERGELDLYHDACESGEIDESCPCDECSRERWVRFKAWRETWDRAVTT